MATAVNGHCLLLTMTGTTGSFCIRSVQSSPRLPVLLAAAALLVTRHQKKAAKKADK